MIAMEKLHQNLSDFTQFSLKKIFEVDKKQFFSIEEMRNAGNCIYEYVHSFPERIFNPILFTG